MFYFPTKSADGALLHEDDHGECCHDHAPVLRDPEIDFGEYFLECVHLLLKKKFEGL